MNFTRLDSISVSIDKKVETKSIELLVIDGNYKNIAGCSLYETGYSYFVMFTDGSSIIDSKCSAYVAYWKKEKYYVKDVINDLGSRFDLDKEQLKNLDRINYIYGNSDQIKSL